MANDDWNPGRGGLLPLQYPFGHHQVRFYRLTTSAAAAVFIGQPLDLDATGRVAPATPSDNSFILGPALAFLDTNLAGLPSSQFALSQGPQLAANTDAFIGICDDPTQVFVIQADSGGTNVAETNIGNTATWLYRSSSGSTVTGYSTVELDQSDLAADTSGQFTLVGLADYANSDGTQNSFGQYTKLAVRVNRHRLAAVPATQNI